MRANVFIRHVLAAFLLLLFGFSILPKKTVHDWLATHHDGSGSAKAFAGQQLTTAGFMCHCDDLVVESPFTEAQPNPLIYPFRIPICVYTVPVVDPVTADPVILNLRGPPAFV